MVFQKTINRLTKMVWHKRRGKNMEKEIRHPTHEECEATIRRITGSNRRKANINPQGKPTCGMATVRVIMKHQYPGDGCSPEFPSTEMNGIAARTPEEKALLKKLILNSLPLEEEESEEVIDLAAFLENNTPAY
jgi:hypothetical protein